MSVGRCVNRALLAMERKDFEDAFIQVSIAVAATAGRENPDIKSDREKYRKFIRENIALITKTGFFVTMRAGLRLKLDHPDLKVSEDGAYSLDEILYCVVRCCLIHEAGLPENLVAADEQKFKTEGEDSPAMIPSSLVYGMAVAVLASSVNAEEVVPGSHALRIEGETVPFADIIGKRDELNARLGL